MITGSLVNTNSLDVTTLSQTGAASILLFNNNHIKRAKDNNYKQPTLFFSAGRTIAEGNYADDKGKGAGIFMAIGNDNRDNKVIGNSSPHWPFYAPPLPKGVYQFD